MLVLVLGSKGLLGWDIVRQLAIHNIAHISLGKEYLDIGNELQLHRFWRYHRPDYVINCAAYTDVPGAESNVSQAHKLNTVAAGTLAKVCATYGARLIHFSTDFVFDGHLSRPYLETDEVNPLNVYGRSKADGESVIQQVGKDYKIFRTQWLYGYNGPCFPMKIIEAYKTKEVVEVIDNQYGCPNSAEFVAQIVMKVISEWNDIETGVYHLTHDNHCSWYDWANLIFKGFQMEPSKLKEVSYKKFYSKVIRPNYGVLDNSKLKNALKLGHLGVWQDDFYNFINQYGSMIARR